MKLAATTILILILVLKVGTCSADEAKGEGATLLKLRNANNAAMLLEAIPEAKAFSDKALSTYVARKLARNYPFSPTALEFLNAARTQTPEKLNDLKGGDFWFLPLTLLRILVIASGLLMLPAFGIRTFRTFAFCFLIVVLIVGEGLNLSRGLFSSVFIPFEGQHFSFSAPEVSSQAVEKLPPGVEIKISENAGDWLKLDLPSGRVGWVSSNDGVIENEEQ